ncbi:MAG: ThuA domain-containing protein [Planctomycetaceae bacterium]|nr:ThuA domain-containing protein [Planctomycetaceae bacterium]
MTRFHYNSILLAFAAALLSSAHMVPYRAFAEEEKTLNILIVTGGHGFDEKTFYGIFDQMPGIHYDKISLPADMDRLAPGLEKEYDVLLTYDMNQFPVTEEQMENYARLIKAGMPLLVLHHSFCAYPNWAEYRKIAGGTWLYKPAEIDGKEWKVSSGKGNVSLVIDVADKNHPITQGIDSFTVVDEAYQDIYIRSDVHVLLSTSNPEASPKVAWVDRYGEGAVFTLLLGHDKNTYENPSYQKLLQQGIQWLASQRKTLTDNK